MAVQVPALWLASQIPLPQVDGLRVLRTDPLQLPAGEGTNGLVPGGGGSSASRFPSVRGLPPRGTDSNWLGLAFPISGVAFFCPSVTCKYQASNQTLPGSDAGLRCCYQVANGGLVYQVHGYMLGGEVCTSTTYLDTYGSLVDNVANRYPVLDRSEASAR